MIVVGLDLSLTHTGYAVLNSSATVLHSGVIKSKPSGDLPIDETNRIAKIVSEILDKIEVAACDERPELVVIEGIAFAARNTTSLAQLAGLNYVVRVELAKEDIPFIIVAPSSLKKFITGSGKGDKDMMMMAVYKNYGFEAVDNNECDAYALALCGLAALSEPVKKLGVPQQEVINLLKKQI